MDNYISSSERSALARDIAREGIVLLKNEEKMLPFGKERVAVFGRTQIDTIKCGTGSAFCKSEYCVSILDGMENAGINTDAELAARYRKWCTENQVASFGLWGSGSHMNPEMPISEDEIADIASRTEKAVLVIGRTAGENDDVIYREGDFLLSAEESALLCSLRRNYGKIAVIINSGNLIDLSFTECDEIKALLLLNFPGMEGGNALGDILCGKCSPSGKLTDTVARHYADHPSSEYFGKKSGIIQEYYEDIFVGYRYFETFCGKGEKVLYPFGHGLSYTEFEKKLLSFECDSDATGEVRVKILVKNTGSEYSAKETVMLYSSSPSCCLRTPKYELRTFKKTRLLSPGEEEILTLSYPISRMASFDDTGALGKADSWVMEKGEYSVYFGNNVQKLELAGVFGNPCFAVIKECAHIPTELSKRLTPDGCFESLDAISPNVADGIPIGPFSKVDIGPEQYISIDGNSVLFRINVTVAGAYNMRLNADESCEVYIDGSLIENSEAYFSESGGEMILPLSTCEFVFRGKENAPEVSMSFEKLDETVHISAEGVSVVEGGKFSECALCVISREFKDPDGDVKYGKGLFRMHTPGRNATYKLDVEKAGFYDVTLRYTTYRPSRKLEDTYSFMINNVKQDMESVELPTTTDDEEVHVFRTVGPISLALPAGEAYLKLISLTTDTPLLAYMEFKPCTRVVNSKKKEKAEVSTQIKLDENMPDGGKFPRKVLPPKESRYDFRNVLSGELSLDEFICSLSDSELARLTCGNSNGQIAYIPERGIPESYWSDGPVGFRQNYAVTVYPSATMVAASWNTELAYEFGKSIGTEANLYNVDVWLAPAINIHRDPCCGRNFEYMSEDPYLTGTIASAIVKGVQEHDVAVTVKHFAANNTEYQRLKSNSRVSARAMREIYMKAVETVISESKPYSIMTSYNILNGTRVSENPLYCHDILRGDFGFDGMIMSDFANAADHVKELSADQDLKMHFGDSDGVVEAMKNGTLERARVRECVKRILTLVMLTTVKNEKK